MASTASRTLVSLAVSLAAVGAYHVLFVVPRAAPRPESEEDPSTASEASVARIEALDSLTRRLDAVRAEADGAGGASVKERTDARVASLARRLAALERAGTPPHLNDASPSPRRAWTPDRVDQLRDVLDEIDARKVRMREEERVAGLLEALAPGLAPDLEGEATDLLADFFVRVRSAYDITMKGYRDHVSAEAMKQAVEARVDLELKIRALLPREVADLLLERIVPVFPPPAGKIRPRPLETSDPR